MIGGTVTEIAGMLAGTVTEKFLLLVVKAELLTEIGIETLWLLGINEAGILAWTETKFVTLLFIIVEVCASKVIEWIQINVNKQ